MATHVLLLRGVNLGKHNKLNMQKLCVALTNKGLEDVKYHLQSGNVLLKSKKKSATLETEVSQIIKQTFNIDVPVLAIDKKTYKDYVDNFPFENKTKDWKEMCHFTFLAEKPSAEKVDELLAEQKENEKVVVYNQIAYLFLEKKYHESIINNNFIEKKLGVMCTTRNRNTFDRISTMLDEK